MNNFGNFKFILNDPFNQRREFVKKEGGRPETKGEDHIEEIKPFPFHTQKFPIRRVDGNVAKCWFYVKFGHEASWTKILKYGNCVVNLYVLQRIGFGRDVGVDTGGVVFRVR